MAELEVAPATEEQKCAIAQLFSEALSYCELHAQEFFALQVRRDDGDPMKEAANKVGAQMVVSRVRELRALLDESRQGEFAARAKPLIVGMFCRNVCDAIYESATKAVNKLMSESEEGSQEAGGTLGTSSE